MSLSDPSPASLLRYRPFVWFLSARICGTIAIQMQTVAVGWQIYDLTHSPLDLGLVGLAQFLPAILLFLFAGHVADRYDRRLVFRLCLAVEAAAVALLAWATMGGWITKEVILATAGVLGAARAFESPSQSSLLPTVVPADLFPRAVVASGSGSQFATIGGPAIGGLVYAASPVAAYAIASVLLLLASVMIALVRRERAALKRETFSFQSLFAGFAFMRATPIVLGAIALDLFAVLLGGATALLPVFARDILATDAQGLGLLRACPAVGALAVSLLLMRWPLRARVGRIMYTAVAVFGVATIVFALSGSLLVSMVALGVLGAADFVSVVIRSTLVQLQTPDAMRGRVSAVNSMFIGTSNQLGEFRAGVMAYGFGTVPAVLIGGIGTLLVVALWTRLFPQLFNVDGLSPPGRAAYGASTEPTGS